MSTTIKEEFITPQAGEILRVMRRASNGHVYELAQVNYLDDEKPFEPSDQRKPFVWQFIDGNIQIWRQSDEKILVRTAVITEQEF